MRSTLGASRGPPAGQAEAVDDAAGVGVPVDDEDPAELDEPEPDDDESEEPDDDEPDDGEEESDAEDVDPLGTEEPERESVR